MYAFIIIFFRVCLSVLMLVDLHIDFSVYLNTKHFMCMNFNPDIKSIDLLIIFLYKMFCLDN